jgi:hypothetical protein
LAAGPQQPPDAWASATVPQQVLTTGTWAVVAGPPQHELADGADATAWSTAMAPVVCVVWVVMLRFLCFDGCRTSLTDPACTLFRHLSS